MILRTYPDYPRYYSGRSGCVPAAAQTSQVWEHACKAKTTKKRKHLREEREEKVHHFVLIFGRRLARGNGELGLIYVFSLQLSRSNGRTDEAGFEAPLIASGDWRLRIPDQEGKSAYVSTVSVRISNQLDPTKHRGPLLVMTCRSPFTLRR